MQLQKISCKRQLDSVKQIDNQMLDLIKSNFNKSIAIVLQQQYTKQ